MQWMMLQQDSAEDYVIATGQQVSVRDFLIMSAKNLGLTLKFEGQGADEVVIADGVNPDITPHIKPGDVILRIDPRYFRPAEVDTLLGDASKAKAKLGWEPQITLEQMCAEMIDTDLNLAKRHAFLKQQGYDEIPPIN